MILDTADFWSRFVALICTSHRLALFGTQDAGLA